MFIDAHDAGVKELSADLVIIGAGAAGITLARQFAGARTSVLLLESGRLDYDSAQQDLYQGSLTGLGAMPLHLSRLRYFGGTTNHWAGWCRPLEAEDFAARADWPESGWPFARTALDRYYKAAAELTELGPFAFDDLGFWQRQSGGSALRALALETDRLRTALFQVSKPTRFGQRYRRELEAASNIKVVLDADVLELLPDPATSGANRRVAGLLATNAAGKRIQVTGKLFVLAVGGIETPRVLLSSTRMHPNGAGNEHDLVGRYYQDHAWLTQCAMLRFAPDARTPRSLPLYYDITEVAGAKVFGVLAPNPTKAIAAGIGGFRLWLKPLTTSTQGMDSLRQTLSQLSERHWPDHLGDHLGNMLADWDVIVNNLYKTTFKTNKDLMKVASGQIQSAAIDLNFEQRPSFDSRVRLGKAADRHGIRQVEVDWRLGEDDRRTATTALQWAAEAFGQMGLGRTRITLDVANGKPWPKEMTGSCHHMGTARMAASPSKGVVNADGRVHSIDNLYVAGSAVFPTSGYANPTLTIVALALRLADHLKERF